MYLKKSQLIQNKNQYFWLEYRIPSSPIKNGEYFYGTLKEVIDFVKKLYKEPSYMIDVYDERNDLVASQTEKETILHNLWLG